ncbi:MAG: hypothetical protein MK105_18150 [Crocinitomicaceae bacterium]|nr:hypothetical protein [Crocinitomicaceae bacterium]
MRDNKAISLLSGLVITAVILVVIAFVYFLLTFDLAGGETLQEIENQRTAVLILSIVIVGFTVLVCRRFINTGKKYVAIGTGILPMLTLIMVSVYYVNNFNYQTPLDQTIWKQEKWKPFDMAASLVKDNVLIGMTRAEVKELLGSGYEEGYGNVNPNKGFISYLVKQDWTLDIYFENDKVVDVKLRLPSMMT